jgi:hypothetical protein
MSKTTYKAYKDWVQSKGLSKLQIHIPTTLMKTLRQQAQSISLPLAQYVRVILNGHAFGSDQAKKQDGRPDCGD